MFGISGAHVILDKVKYDLIGNWTPNWLSSMEVRVRGQRKDRKLC
jgi:hypothetical protein